MKFFCEKLSVALSRSGILNQIEPVFGLTRGLDPPKSSKSTPKNPESLLLLFDPHFLSHQKYSPNKQDITNTATPTPVNPKTRAEWLLLADPTWESKGTASTHDIAPLLSGPASFTTPAAYKIVK